MNNDGAVGNKTESMCISEVNPTGHVKRVGDDINTADDKKEKKRESDSSIIEKMRRQK